MPERKSPLSPQREKELRQQADARRNPSSGFTGKWLRELFDEIDRIRAEYAELSLEADALRREVDAQMQSKLDAQSLLANLTQALGFERSDFDISDTWRTVGPRIVERLTEIVGRVEELEQERDALEELQPFPVSTVMSWKRRAEEAEARMAAGRILLDPDRQDEPDEENVLRAFEALGGRLS